MLHHLKQQQCSGVHCRSCVQYVWHCCLGRGNWQRGRQQYCLQWWWWWWWWGCWGAACLTKGNSLFPEIVGMFKKGEADGGTEAVFGASRCWGMMLNGSLVTGSASIMGSLRLVTIGAAGSSGLEGSRVSGLDGPSSSSYCSSPEPPFSFPLDVPLACALSSSSILHLCSSVLVVRLHGNGCDSARQWADSSGFEGSSHVFPKLLRPLAAGNGTVLSPAAKPD